LFGDSSDVYARDGKHLNAFDAHSGQAMWRFPMTVGRDCHGSIIVIDSVIYAIMEEHLVALATLAACQLLPTFQNVAPLAHSLGSTPPTATHMYAPRGWPPCPDASAWSDR